MIPPYLGRIWVGTVRCARCAKVREPGANECRHCHSRLYYDAERPDWWLLFCDCLILGVVVCVTYWLARGVGFLAWGIF